MQGSDRTPLSDLVCRSIVMKLLVQSCVWPAKLLRCHYVEIQRCCSFGAQNGGCCRVGSDCPSDVDAGLEKRWDQLEVFHVEYSPLAVGETEGHRRWTVAQSACPDRPLGVLLWHNLPQSCHKNKPRSVIITWKENLEGTQEQLWVLCNCMWTRVHLIGI